jgi:hypothetical protein
MSDGYLWLSVATHVTDPSRRGQTSRVARGLYPLDNSCSCVLTSLRPIYCPVACVLFGVCLSYTANIFTLNQSGTINESITKKSILNHELSAAFGIKTYVFTEESSLPTNDSRLRSGMNP